MTWFADLSPCTYFPTAVGGGLVAVGWLERSHEYAIGNVDRAVYERLRDLLADAWQPAVWAGSHSCDLCQMESEAHGHKNLFVPSDDAIYACPELILHYVNAHRYSPPQEFCRAVLNCPDTRTMEYKRKLIAAGWRSPGI